MSKYSSDSDSQTEKYHKKSHSRRSRERSYSSDSSSSKTRRRKEKKYRRDRSKSRGSDKYSSSRRDRSSSRHRTKSYYSSKSSRYSHSPERSKKGSPSRDRYRKHKRSKSRERSSKPSRSTSRNRHRRTRKSASRDRKEKSPSTSSSSSSSVEIKNVKVKETNLEKAMKAAEIAKKKLKIPEPIKEEISTIVLDEINDDSFAPKPFVSKAKKSDHIVIDLKAQTIKMPECEITEPDSIFHPNLFQNEEARTEKWVKELFTYRQKAINGELLIV